MKKFLLFLLAISVVIFVNYLILTLIGCFSGVCGASDGFYCSVFCNLAKFIIAATIIVPIAIAGYKSIKQNN